MRRAHELAEDRRDPAVVPAHLLLGILTSPSSSATAILVRFEIGPSMLSSHLCKLLPATPEAANGGTAETSDAVRQSLSIAAAEASAMGGLVRTGHLLLGVLADRRSVVAMILRDHGLTQEGVRAALRQHLDDEKEKPRGVTAIKRGASTDFT